MTHRPARFARPLAAVLLLSSALGSTSCGGGGGGGGNNNGAAMVLVSFLQAGEDNVPLNRVLEFTFSSTLDVATVGSSSIQIRVGPLFGESVDGRYLVQGNKAFFEPRLPSTCALADAGFRADTDYRVTLIGSPEEFALRSSTGDPLESTISFSFHTRSESDPAGLFEDQVPGVFPFVVSTSPADGARPPDPDVSVGPGNRVRIEFSENIDPCTISATTVRFNQWATGNPADFPNGFNPDADQTPGDPFTWGSGNAQIPPQRIRSQYVLTQNFVSTRLDITPDFGEFPDNALLVVEVTSDVKDFGGNPAVPKAFAFVTENRAEQCQARTLKFDGDVPVNTDLTTADVDTPRAPDRAQGFLLFAGDGDNGASTTTPSGPECIPWEQVNDGTPDDFDAISVDIVLDTGASLNTQCDNEVDGSRAVVFEFRTFRIRAGRTVKLVGRNPAIILVSGDVLIESGGRLLVKSDGTAGTPNANGLNGVGGAGNVAPGAAGGRGVLGAGSGGMSADAPTGLSGTIYGNNGEPGFGSPNFGQAAGMGGLVDPVLIGPGRGAVNTGHTTSTQTVNRMAAGGGGGGHATAGANGAANGNGQSPTFNDGGGFVDGTGGPTYGDPFGRMPTPEAGSGGGGGGVSRAAFGGSFAASGGGGGAGGGFVDLTSSGTIRVFGTIDASGGMGGGGGQSFSSGGGGGGGGSGGGVRLLTPIAIQVASSTTISAIGGGGGGGGLGSVGGGTGAVANPGGAGGVGRLVFEDGDSVIDGYTGASIVPGETSSAGFYRGLFDAARFQGGGLTPQLLTGVIDMGPTFPTFVEPVQTYGGQEDFVAAIPAIASRGVGATSILIEVQGFPVNSDGSIDQTHPSGWSRIGYFTDSGAESFPTWNAGTPGDVTLPPGGVDGGFAHVNAHEFIQFRITFFLKDNVGPFDPGPFLDDWTIHFCYDQ